MLYHVLNRGVGRQKLFFDDEDYLAFERVLAETLQKTPMRVCGYCLMPNHWHFVLWPKEDDDLARFMQQLTVTHTARWKQHKKQVGFGHLYQGRYKSFPIESDEHFFVVVRYVERNALRAGLVRRAEQWMYGSLWIREFGGPEHRALLSDWPLRRSGSWVEFVNRAETESELAALRKSTVRGTPFGDPQWVDRTCKRLNLECTLRPRGRPRNPLDS